MPSPHIEAEVVFGDAEPRPGPSPNPTIYAALFAPFGISSGYVGVTLAYLLRDAGIAVVLIAFIASLSVWMQVLKMLWAPVVDTVGSPKMWYGIGTVTVGLSILLMSVLPMTKAEIPIFIALIVGSSVTSTFVSMSTEISMANLVRPEQRGIASAWSQAGNLGGNGIGGGVGLLLAQHVTQQWVSGAVLALACLACWAPMFFMPRVERTSEALNYLGELKEVVANVWEVARSRLGYLALVIMLLPIGSGGVPWAAISKEWGAHGDMVAIVNGMGGGGAAIVGSLTASFFCNRMDLKRAYCMFGIFVGLVAVAMIFAPRSPTVFAIGVLGYNAMVGMAYTGYAAIVLEAIGKKSAATNWNLMAALSNAPIAAMGMFDGWVYDTYGSNMMLLGELALPATAILLFGLFVLVTRPRRARA